MKINVSTNVLTTTRTISYYRLKINAINVMMLVKNVQVQEIPIVKLATQITFCLNNHVRLHVLLNISNRIVIKLAKNVTILAILARIKLKMIVYRVM